MTLRVLYREMTTKPSWEEREEKIIEVRNLEKICGMRKGRENKSIGEEWVEFQTGLSG